MNCVLFNNKIEYRYQNKLITFLLFILFCSCQFFPLQKKIPKNKSFIFSHPYLSLRGKCHYKTNKNAYKMHFYIKIKMHKHIWCSLRSLLGTEVLRVFITQENIIVINHIYKTYYIYSYKDIQNFLHLPIHYTMIQDILVQKLPNTLHTKSTYHNNGTIQKSILYTLNDKKGIVATYSAKQIKNYFPSSQSIQLYTKKNSIFLQLNFKKVKYIQKNISFPFKIPPAYATF